MAYNKEFPIIILISGYSGSGKDTLARKIRYALSEDDSDKVACTEVLITHFADLVKFVCETFLYWNGEKNFIGRMMLQYVGTDLFKSYDTNYWTDFIADIIRIFAGNWRYVIIPDNRFLDEIDRMKEHFGYNNVITIKVVRQEIESKAKSSYYLHRSESELPTSDYSFDLVVPNDGTEEDLEIIAKQIASDLLGYEFGFKNLKE